MEKEIFKIESTKYDVVRKWILTKEKEGKTWNEIRTVFGRDIEQFLKFQEFNDWPPLTVENYQKIVDSQKRHLEQNSIYIQDMSIVSRDPENTDEFFIPEGEGTAWQLLKQKMKDKGYSDDSVSEIEDSTIKILRCLKTKTTKKDPVKGIVIGNVQSGKTGNMAALMAMAADHGFNMFIILSGTIENLRKQTQQRLVDDLSNEAGNIHWTSLEHLSAGYDSPIKISKLHLKASSRTRYFTVCLKYSTRLKNQLSWLLEDPKILGKLKVLIIDDEADQAGINTNKIEEETERTVVNQTIINMVDGKKNDGTPADGSYGAMNYIGYTATPYANILNEGASDSLYPKNFIACLATSNEYFGPQQIFGLPGGNYHGLDIVRKVNVDDLEEIKGIHNHIHFIPPKSLVDAICWFIDAVACQRYWNFKKPVSMLIHTSQNTTSHNEVANVIEEWFENHSVSQILEHCESIWKTETARFPKDKFLAQYPDYGKKELIRDYPEFSEIRNYAEELISNNLTHIKLGNEGEFKYGKGIHLCIDNCKSNKLVDGNSYMRLAFPERQKDNDITPAFIVIGGATLSRGLTIEGLVSSYFLRTTKQADTLMQMGRWFGYRRGYELLPRIWLSERTIRQFKFLSSLDDELKQEIETMCLTGRSPAEYGPHVKKSLDANLIDITGKKRQQSAEPVAYDFTGSLRQTYIFDKNRKVQEENLNTTADFLKGLGKQADAKTTFKQKNAVWRDVSFSEIQDFLNKFHFSKEIPFVRTLAEYLSWIGDITRENKLGRWNVVLIDGNKKTERFNQFPVSIHKVNRSELKDENNDMFWNIGTLLNPLDLLSDINPEDPETLKNKDRILDRTIKSNEVKGIRDLAGLNTTPQLAIYVVDKKSTAGKNGENTTRSDLNAPTDMVGLSIYIPGGKKGTSYTSQVAINMSKYIFDGITDLEEPDED